MGRQLSPLGGGGGGLARGLYRLPPRKLKVEGPPIFVMVACPVFPRHVCNHHATACSCLVRLHAICSSWTCCGTGPCASRGARFACFTKASAPPHPPFHGVFTARRPQASRLNGTTGRRRVPLGAPLSPTQLHPSPTVTHTHQPAGEGFPTPAAAAGRGGAGGRAGPRAGDRAPFNNSAPQGGGGVGTRPRYLIVCLWRRLLASRHCSF